jgi:hypothetical protein
MDGPYIDLEWYVKKSGIISKFEDLKNEDKIHGSGKDGNRFLLHY